MRRALRLLTVTLLWAAIPLLAAAQGDDALQRHAVALDNLVASVNQLGVDNLASLDALESAASTMRLVARDTDSSNLVTAMEQIFDNARLAIRNQSRTDLAVQVAVLRGGFQRALLERSLAGGSVEGARPGLGQLSSELGLDGATLDGLEAAGSLEQLLRTYQAGLARNMASRIEVMQTQFPESQEDAYVTLAGAYGMSLSLQDAPQTPASLNADFSELITAVVAGDAEAVAAGAADLTGTLAGLGAAEAGEPPAADQPPAADAQQLQEPQPEVEPAAEAAAAVAEPEPASPPAVAEQPAEVAPPVAEEAAPELPADPVTGEEAASGDETEITPAPAAAPADVETLRADLLAEQEQLAIDSLLNDLGRRGLRGQAGENLALQLHNRGFTSVADLLGTGLELTARASDAAFRGNQAAARQHLAQLQTLYQANLAPLASRADPTLDTSIRELLERLSASPAIRAVELQALTGLLASIGSTAGSSLADSVQAGSAGWTSGWPRMVLLILVALLTILPLTFLRLAFGGGNRNWSLIGAGLFLLLLPVILGGLGALLELVGHLAGVPALLQAGAWLSLDGALQQLLLLVLVLLATILLATGLYGICKQFGLFGGESGGKRLFSRSRAEGKSETKTLVDWDEEF